MKVSKATIIRTTVLMLGLVNAALALFGKSPLPFDDAELTNAITAVWAVVASLWAWWKNNSFTKKAIAADKTLK
jgi:SPP1 family holin